MEILGILVAMAGSAIIAGGGNSSSSTEATGTVSHLICM